MCLPQTPPKISIITATLNAAHTLPSTLDSILAQDYAHIEHIIIDGKSSDDTLTLIESYRPKYALKGYEFKVSSQKDSGIYDTMNKGLALASGAIIGFLNADDFFAHSKVISLIAWGFSKPTDDVQIVYADIVFVDKNLSTIRTLNAKPYYKNAFYFGFHPPHPSFYAKREIYQTYGGFNLKYKIANDYELMLRFLEKYHLKSLYIQECFVKMRAGGVSNANLKNIIRANVECVQSFRDNALCAFPIFIALKPLSKIFKIHYIQVIKKLLGGADENLIEIIHYLCLTATNSTNYPNISHLDSTHQPHLGVA